MKSTKHTLRGGMFVVVLLAAIPSTFGRQVQTTDTPGSPHATTISGKQLPAPRPRKPF